MEAEWQECCTSPVGEEAEVADAHEADGNRWSRKRRKNSSTARVMSLFLLPWAESRQRKVTLPWEKRPVCGWRWRRDGCKRRDSAARVPAHRRAAGIDDPVMTEQCTQPGCEGSRLGKRREVAVELERARWKALRSPATNLPRKTRLSTFTGRRKSGARRSS